MIRETLGDCGEEESRHNVVSVTTGPLTHSCFHRNSEFGRLALEMGVKIILFFFFFPFFLY